MADQLVRIDQALAEVIDIGGTQALWLSLGLVYSAATRGRGAVAVAERKAA